jgi:hypothetical protein
VTPFYEHAGITIYHGDCRDVIDLWEGSHGVKAFDLLLTGSWLRVALRRLDAAAGIRPMARWRGTLRQAPRRSAVLSRLPRRK